MINWEGSGRKQVITLNRVLPESKSRVLPLPQDVWCETVHNFTFFIFLLSL